MPLVVYFVGVLLLCVRMAPLAGLSRVCGVFGLAAIAVGLSYPTPAGATFSGAQNGNVAFASICDSNTGQAIYSISPNGSPVPTYTCPGGTSPNYTQSTAGSIDSMPYFSAQGTTLYFSSNRPSGGNNPGAGGNFAIYQVTYPPTVTGSPGSQSDGAVQITFPTAGGGSSNDYAPTVSADGTELTFIRCNAGTTSCALYVQSPIVGGTPTLVSTSVAPLQPNPVSGEASRPEIDPADPSQILYVGTDNNIHLVSLASPPAFAERDLSTESGIPAGQIDEYPDWNPAGTRIIFDRSHDVYVLNPTSGPATACQLWTSDPGTEIEPIFAPTDTAVSSGTTCNPAGNMYVWTKLGGGSNVMLDEGHAVGNPSMLVDLTNDRTNNSQPAWQPVPLGSQTPEVPVAVILPAAGGALLAGAVLLERRRRRDLGAVTAPAYPA
jgi:hypothetical protein